MSIYCDRLFANFKSRVYKLVNMSINVLISIFIFKEQYFDVSTILLYKILHIDRHTRTHR